MSSSKTFTSKRRNGIFARKKSSRKSRKTGLKKNVSKTVQRKFPNKKALKKSLKSELPASLSGSDILAGKNFCGWLTCARQSVMWDPSEFATLDFESAEASGDEISTPEFREGSEPALFTPHNTDFPKSNSLGKRSSCGSLAMGELIRVDSKRQKSIHQPSEEKAEAVEPQTELKLAAGDRVKILKGAKKKFIGKCGRVEKYLISKEKWGLVLDNKKRIALPEKCLEKVTTLMALTQMAKQKSIDQYNEFCQTGYGKRHRNPKKIPFSMVAAIRESRLDIIKTLIITNKCDINCKNALKQNSLHISCQYGKDDCALLLIEMGIKINKADSEGRTPLMFAAMEGSIEIVKGLVSANAHLNDQDNDGMSALMHATKNGHLEVVQLLLKEHAYIDLENSEGQNALTVALEAQNQIIAEKLMEASLAADDLEIDITETEFLALFGKNIEEKEQLKILAL